MNYEVGQIVSEAEDLYLSHLNNANVVVALKGDDPVSNVLAIDKAQTRYDTNLQCSLDHFNQHRDVLIEDAISGARADGVEIDYPPYTS